MKSSLRGRLLAVAFLSVITCAGSIASLARLLATTNAQRIERARDAVNTELTLLRKDSVVASPKPPAPVSLLGMRGGYARSTAAFDADRPDLDAQTRAALARTIRDAAGADDAVLHEETYGDTMLVVAAAPTDAGRLGASPAPTLADIVGDGAETRPFAWVSYVVHISAFVVFWRFIVGLMTIGTVLLVTTAIRTVGRVRRDAATLNASLGALATDLSATVVRPPTTELAEVSDGIAVLAKELARAQREKELLGVELAQRERLSALGRVAAGVAHEVRNPLASIKLRVDLGRQRHDIPATLATELTSVSEEITRLDRLVADLLVVAGRKSGPRTSTRLGPLVERRVGLLRPWADERGIRLAVAGDASAELDVDAVARAVDNLVRNAVEASPQGSSVMVEVATRADAAVVRVIDQGEGVDAARLPELFEPFFTTKPEGTGLGLALSRAIAAAHGGALTYTRDDARTCFELRFARAGLDDRDGGGGGALKAAGTEASDAAKPLREAHA